MRAAHLTWVMSPLGGGIPPVIAALAEAQQRLAAEVRIFGVEDPLSPALQSGVEQKLGRIRGPRALGYAPELAEPLRAFAPRVLHLHGLFTWSSRAAERWGAATKQPVIVAPHGMLEPWALANSRWKKRVFLGLVERRNLERAACLHALNPEEAENIRRFGLKQPIAIIPNGVEPAPAASTRGRTVAGIQLEERKWLLFLGRIHPKKGLPLLLEAFERLAERELADWGLLIAGPDQLGHRAELEARAARGGLAARVRFTGPVSGEEKERAFSSADAFVLPSYSEGSPVAVLEAMTRRLPVLISRECHLDEVEAVGAGWVRDATVDGVTELLLKLSSLSDVNRREMGERGKAWVDERFSWQQMAKRTLSVYAWLCGSGEKPDCVLL